MVANDDKNFLRVSKLFHEKMYKFKTSCKKTGGSFHL